MTLPSPDRTTVPTGVMDVAALRAELELDDVGFDAGFDAGFDEDDFGTLEQERPRRAARIDPVGMVLVAAMLVLLAGAGSVLVGVLGLLILAQ